MGAHWLKTAGILAPLVIHEFVKDPDKKWRYIRLASVATALCRRGCGSTGFSGKGIIAGSGEGDNVPVLPARCPLLIRG